MLLHGSLELREPSRFTSSSPEGQQLVDRSKEGAAVSSERLHAYDIARGLAFLGMVVVNYRILLSGLDPVGPDWLNGLTDAFTGRAAALFVVVAGAGISLMASRAKEKDAGLAAFRFTLCKRALFLREALARLDRAARPPPGVREGIEVAVQHERRGPEAVGVLDQEDPGLRAVLEPAQTFRYLDGPCSPAEPDAG